MDALVQAGILADDGWNEVAGISDIYAIDRKRPRIEVAVYVKEVQHDIVEVVRCKDCKRHEGECLRMVYCPNQVGGWVREDFYCADGERRK